ncbi:RNA polymerase sigma factor [Microbacterium sp. NPDC090225]|uniref:RNA polymerase sigma factor n=1 Tax=Microbacterium sp. NPDC090225 TaxID=3364207 RepID=UPI0037FD7CF1
MSLESAEEVAMSIEVFADFYNRYHRLMVTVAEQRLRGVGSAEDVVAEVFRIAWSHHKGGEQLALPWLYQVLRNVIGNEYRRIAASGRLTEAMAAVTVDEIEERADDDALEVRRALERLPVGDRDLLYMAYWEDLTRQEIATILGCSAVTVRVRLLRARQRLKGELERVGFADIEEVRNGRD